MTLVICYIEQLGRDRPYEGINTKGLFGGIMALPTTINEQLCPISRSA